LVRKKEKANYQIEIVIMDNNRKKIFIEESKILIKIDTIVIKEQYHEESKNSTSKEIAKK
jgi:hypothetical protein